MKARSTTIRKAVAVLAALGWATSASAATYGLDFFDWPVNGTDANGDPTPGQEVKDSSTSLGSAAGVLSPDSSIPTLQGLNGGGAVNYNSLATPPQFSEVGPAPGSATLFTGYRDLFIDKASTSTSGAATMQVLDGTLKFNNESGVKSMGFVQWDGADASPSLNLAGSPTNFLTACGTPPCDRFTATVVRSDAAIAYGIGVFTDSTHWSVLYSGTLFGVTNYETYWNFDWFSFADNFATYGGASHFEDGLPFWIEKGTSGGVDLANVRALQLVFSSAGNADLDLTIDSVGLAVPEPGSLALAGLALTGLGALRRRKASIKDN